MTRGEFLKKAWPALIKVTNDPTAPMKMQKAYAAVDAVGRMLASSGTNAELVRKYHDTLVVGFTDDEIEVIATTPEFLIALASSFCTAMIHYTTALVEAEEKAKQ
jgi:hypothetical protein